MAKVRAMRRVVVAVGLIALAAAGSSIALVLPAASAPASAARLATTPLTITIAPPPVTSTTSSSPVAPAALVSILATGDATNLDARLRPSVAKWLRTQPSLAAELGPLSASPAAECVLLLAAFDAKDYPTMGAVAPIVVRLAYAEAHGSGGPGVLLTIERLARAAALLGRARS